jgi:hypothetical protein
VEAGDAGESSCGGACLNRDVGQAVEVNYDHVSESPRLSRRGRTNALVAQIVLTGASARPRSSSAGGVRYQEGIVSPDDGSQGLGPRRVRILRVEGRLRREVRDPSSALLVPRG